MGMATGRPARQARIASSAASRISAWISSGSRPVSLSPRPRTWPRAVRGLEPVHLPGELHEHHQQHRNVGHRDRLGQPAGVIVVVRQWSDLLRVSRGWVPPRGQST